MRTAPFILVAVCAAFLHGIWEFLHLPLYTNYQTLGVGHEVVAYATAGDVMYTLCIAAAIAALLGDGWLLKLTPSRYLFIAASGLLIAMFVEYKALYLHTWQYSALMPLIPLLNIGLSPILQMTLLAPVSFYCARILDRAITTVPRNQV